MPQSQSEKQELLSKDSDKIDEAQRAPADLEGIDSAEPRRQASDSPSMTGGDDPSKEEEVEET